jgi:hypothetical protein
LDGANGFGNEDTVPFPVLLAPQVDVFELPRALAPLPKAEKPPAPLLATLPNELNPEPLELPNTNGAAAVPELLVLGEDPVKMNGLLVTGANWLVLPNTADPVDPNIVMLVVM